MPFLDMPGWMTLLVQICLVILALIAIGCLNRYRLEHKRPLPKLERQKLEARLLDYIKGESGDAKEVVRLDTFWRRESKASKGAGETFGRRVALRYRTQILSDLEKKKHIKWVRDPVIPPKPKKPALERTYHDSINDALQGAIDGFVNTSASFLNYSFAVPPEAVRLTDGTFQRMLQPEVTGWTIIGGTVTYQHVEGNFDNSPVINAGNDATVSVGNITNAAPSDAFTPKVINELLEIVRSDAKAAPQPLRGEIRAAANELEEAVDGDEPAPDAILSGMDRIRGAISGAGDVMTASSKAVQAWFDLSGKL
ncbi:hypothetical protein NUM3379_22630 [Kineococcus sp. NUM-3379]